MPDLDFNITSAKAKPYAAAPTLSFNLEITNKVPGEEVYAAALKCQVIIEATKRQYADDARDDLREVFGTPERWEETVRALFWTTINIPVPTFRDRTIVEVPVSCGEDHITAAGKYFFSMRDGIIPLAFLFSGTLFYKGESSQLQVTQVSWEKEAYYKLPVEVWRDMIDSYFPNARWLSVRNDIFARLYRYKALHSFPTLESCLESMIDNAFEQSPIKQSSIKEQLL